MVFDHVADLKVFHHNALIAFGIGFRRLEMMIAPLSMDLQMGLGHIASGFAAAMTALLASAQLPLLAPQRFLRATIPARIVYRLAFRVSQEGFQPDIQANVRMRTSTGKMGPLGFCFTDNERVPVPIRTQDEMNGLRGALRAPMEVNFEEVPQLLGDDQVFFVLMQIGIFSVLPQLDGVPTVGLFETWEPDPGERLLFGREEPLEGLTQPICQHLHRGGWHVSILANTA